MPKKRRTQGGVAAVRKVIRLLQKAKLKSSGVLMRTIHNVESRLHVALGDMKPHTTRPLARILRRKARKQAQAKRKAVA